MMGKCPKCNNTISVDRQRFCDKCGCDLTASVLPGVSGKSSPQPAQIITEGGTPNDIALSINLNQFYMEGFTGIIDINITNLGHSAIDSLKVELLGDLSAKNTFHRLCLSPGEAKRRRFQLEKIRTGGIKLVQFRVTTHRGNSIFVYRADATLVVLQKVEDAKDIRFHADSLLNLGTASEKFNIGGVINVNIADMIENGRIKTANDFMREYDKLPPEFSCLNLELEGERYITSSPYRWLSVAAAVTVFIALLVMCGIWLKGSKPAIDTNTLPATTKQKKEQQEQPSRPNETARIAAQKEQQFNKLKATALSYEAKEDWEKATEAYTKALTFRPDDNQVEDKLAICQHNLYLSRAQDAESKGDLDAAISLYTEALSFKHVPLTQDKLDSARKNMQDKIYVWDDGIAHIVAAVKSQISEDSKPIAMMRITGPMEERSQCDLRIEESIFRKLVPSISISWLGLDNTKYRTIISINRSRDTEKPDLLLLSGKITTFQKTIRIPDVRIKLDSELSQALAIPISSLQFVNLLDQAQILQKQNRLVIATACLRGALELEPNNTSAQEMLGQVRKQIEEGARSKVTVKPSFLVSVHDITDNQLAGNEPHAVSTFIQTGLIGRNFTVKNPKLLGEIRESDAAILAGTDKEAYLTMARKYRSEILLWGSCRATLRNDEQLEGQHVYTYDAALRLEVIDSSNADIIASKEWLYHAALSDKTAGFSKPQAAEKAVKKLLELYSDDIFSTIVPRADWSSRGKKYDISFRNVTPEDRKKIIAWFESTEGITEISKPDYMKGILEFAVFYTGESETLIDIANYVLGSDIEKAEGSKLVFVKRTQDSKS